MSWIKVKKILFSLICIQLLSAGSVLCSDVPEDLANDVAHAIVNGKTLYKMYLEGPVKEYRTSDLIDKAKNKITDFCGFKYHAYSADSNESYPIYFIAEPPSQDQIVFGRHYKITENAVIPSTISCFVSSRKPPDEDVVAAFTTHHLSEMPTEFHVFLSLRYRQPIYVRTSRGTWKVELDTIDYVE